MNCSQTQNNEESAFFLPLGNIKKEINSSIPFVLILNGTSSAGKSCISDILLEKINTLNIFSLSIDTFVNMLPERLVGETEESSAGFQFYLKRGALNIRVGKQGDRIIQQMHNVAESLLRSGSNIIIDHVVLTKSWADELENLRKTGAKIIYVLITCGIEELKRRENSRGDRRIGLADGLKHVEDKIQHYDLVVDTTSCSLNEASEMILQYLAFEKSSQHNIKLGHKENTMVV
ncbi:MAG: AAA family ATPase [Candidatus Gracilibacteria bacterium]